MTDPQSIRVQASATSCRNLMVAFALVASGCAGPLAAPSHPIPIPLLEREAVPAILVGQSSDVLLFEHMQFGTTLTYAQIDRIDQFVLETGGTNPAALHMSIVAQDGMPTAAIGRVLIEAGVPPDNVLVYDASERLARGQMRIVASVYNARRPTCGLVRRTVDLSGPEPLPGLGCTQDAALAASIADPLDLIGRPGRREPIVRHIRNEASYPEPPLDPALYK